MKKIKKGFTLVELTLVMAVLGVLVTIVVSSYPNARKHARDSQRISDIKQYQAALEVYANANNGSYPIGSGIDISTLCPATLNLPICPNDPSGGSAIYSYSSDGRRFVIYTALEARNAGSAQWFVVCSSGSSGNISTGPTGSSACPL
ncbi:type II secretion system protein [Candidatus Woesebacteria bacterium]|nr:type II secretion system protein [Candidatus Woesebacteria bacterium]